MNDAVFRFIAGFTCLALLLLPVVNSPPSVQDSASEVAMLPPCDVENGVPFVQDEQITCYWDNFIKRFSRIVVSPGIPDNHPVFSAAFRVGSTIIDEGDLANKWDTRPRCAVTGTNGKTTTTRLIAHIVKNNNYKVGFTTSDGIYIQNHMMEKGDTTGPISAEYVLKDPNVEFAVL